MKTHPAAEIFPLLTGTEFDSLVTDIRAKGLREAIWLDRSGRILDGRNRHRACKEAKVKPRFRTYKGADAVAFVISLNLHRRHLNPSQQAMAAARLARMGHRAMAQPQAAELLNVSRRSVCHAAKVLTDGAVELIAALDQGKISVSDAAGIAELPHPTQRACLKMVAVGKVPTLLAAVRKRDLDRQRRDIAAGRITMPEGLFEVIAIAPPWMYEGEYSAGHWMTDVQSPYPSMSLEELARLQLPAADDCVLWLWTTHRYMRHAYSLLDAWGFEEKAILTWVRDRLGLGQWLRSKSEFCIMAVRGSPKVSLTNQTTVLMAHAREHSRKPDEFYEMVEGLCLGRRLDYFSREPRHGWSQFGNDCARFEGAA